MPPTQTSWPEFFTHQHMEKTLSIYVESINQTWELSDDLVIKLEEYKTEHPIDPGNGNADEVHQAWFATLSDQEQKLMKRETPQN